MDAPVTVAICLAIVAVSLYGFNNKAFYNKYLFEIEGIILKKEYIRLLSSTFLHGDLFHLAFNLIALFSFGGVIERNFGIGIFLGIYFLSLMAANALALWVHKNHYDYRAVGASGAVGGLIYSAVFFSPESKLLIFFIPVPGWLFAIGFLAYTLYGIRKKKDNIGHEAHLGGAIMGVVLAMIIMPENVVKYWWLALALIVPTVMFFLVYLLKPELMFIRDKQWQDIRKRWKPKGRFRDVKNNRIIEESPEQELDRLLDKVSQSGLSSLTDFEQKRLKRLSEIVEHKKGTSDNSGYQAPED